MGHPRILRHQLPYDHMSFPLRGGFPIGWALLCSLQSGLALISNGADFEWGRSRT